MIKFKDLTVGQTCDMVCVVAEATARETKAKKPYLALVLFDGEQQVKANYWDWAGVNMPDRNLVINLKGQVTEYLGELQVTIKSMATNTEVPLTEFSPSSGKSTKDTFLDAYALANEITDTFLRTLSITALEELRDKWMTVPGAKFVHHAYVAGTMIHSVAVTRIAKAIADNTEGANMDLCIAGALLHDIGKLYTYKLNGVVIEMTDEGMAYEHAYIGADLVDKLSQGIIMDHEDNHKLFLLKHIILSHHGILEHGAVVTPLCIEAYIVHHADAVDALSEQIRVTSAKLTKGTMWTEKIWALSNKPHISTGFVGGLFDLCGLE